MTSDRKERNTPARPIRISQGLWDAFGIGAGERNRAKVLVAFMEWYVRKPRAALPKRPDEPIPIIEPTDDPTP